MCGTNGENAKASLPGKYYKIRMFALEPVFAFFWPLGCVFDAVVMVTEDCCLPLNAVATEFITQTVLPYKRADGSLNASALIHGFIDFYREHSAIWLDKLE
jgi:hypothetical protein